MSDNLSSQKSSLRTKLKTLRVALSIDDRRNADQAIFEHLKEYLKKLQITCVFSYLATDDEVGTDAMIDYFIALGVNVVVPKIINREKMIAVTFDGWREMQAGPLGILAPPSVQPFVGEISLAIVPGLGFSPQGARIGYGAGYYDRWLSAHPATRRLGICYETQICAQLPQTSHDVAMHHVLTEKCCY